MSDTDFNRKCILKPNMWNLISDEKGNSKLFQHTYK